MHKGEKEPPHVKCLRCGCPNPRQTPDPTGLGLCQHHNTQFRNGTIGKNHNPTLREHPIEEAQTLLNQISAPGESLRHLATRTGLSKDVIHHIRTAKHHHLRSEAWEQLQEAVAEHKYNQGGEQLMLPLWNKAG